MREKEENSVAPSDTAHRHIDSHNSPCAHDHSGTEQMGGGQAHSDGHGRRCVLPDGQWNSPAICPVPVKGSVACARKKSRLIVSSFNSLLAQVSAQNAKEIQLDE